jgi:pimeloyl-ACP methyl ester carboxylesterase
LFVHAQGDEFKSQIPQGRRLSFVRDEEGLITSLRYDGGNGVPRSATKTAHQLNYVRFNNGDVTLAGNLFTPAGTGPFPAVVMIHGSGDSDRRLGPFATFFLKQGFAVLAYDKRGVGRSEGSWRAANLSVLAEDALAGVEYLKTRPEVDAKRLGFIGFSLSAKAALYVAAFAPEIKATVAIDPHLAMHGDSNYHDPWYLDWRHRFDTIQTEDYPIAELRGTIWSLLDADPARPGFERNHHELIALCAPRAFLLIGCSMDKMQSPHSDNLQSWGYFNRAKEVYDLLGISERLKFKTTNDAHQATSPHTDPDWQQFFEQWLKRMPLDFTSHP